MDTSSLPRTLGYSILLLGIALAFVAAVVPHYETGYRLAGGILLIGLLPYLVYGIAVPLLHKPLTVVVGIVLLIAHASLIISGRFMQAADGSDNLIYIGPMLLALLTLPLVFVALQQDWKSNGKNIRDT